MKTPKSKEPRATPFNRRRCRRCEGPLQPRNVEHPYWNGITLIAVVQEVPSWVCALCGYHYFEPSVESTLKYIVKDYVKMGRVFPIPSALYRDIPLKKSA